MRESFVSYVLMAMKRYENDIVFMQLMLVGRVMTDGKLNARVKADITDKLVLKANAQVS